MATPEDALDGARAILVERFAEDAELIGRLREGFWTRGKLVSTVREGKKTEGAKFADYFDFSEPLTTLPSHRILAVMRGEREDVLDIKMVADPAADPAVREAAEAVAIILSLVAPYTSEDMWNRLGHEPTVFLAGWPEVDPALLVEDSVTCVVQIAGKVREKFDVSPDISEDELRALALAAPGVIKALEGRDIKTVIVRAPKLVNIVPA